MVTLRTVSLAAMLVCVATAPAAAEWWKVGALGGSGSSPAATTVAPAKPAPVRGTQIPEPADFALFAAGVIGLLLGRRGSRSRKRRDDEE